MDNLSVDKKNGAEILCCPMCHNPLSTLKGSTQCTSCGASFKWQGEILDFMPDNDFYWGEISQEKLQSINEQAQREGNWFKAITEQLREQQDFIQYFADIRRLGWLFHSYQYNQNNICVDIGSGLGGLSFKLSRFYKEVYSLDGVRDRLEFQVIRAKEENTPNIHFIRSPLFMLPFQDESVDLVVVNGVLEWIGLSDFSKKPDELQSEFLQEISRILKPTGIVYVGIENRTGAQYIKGGKDHTGLPYTSLLPRPVSSLIMKYLYKKNGKNPHYYFPGFEKGYRTYTYTVWGYEKLLRKAGLGYIDSNWTWPSYNYPKYSGPLDGDSIRHILNLFADRMESKRMRLAARLITHLPTGMIKILHKLFMPHFLFVASKTPLSSTLPHHLYDKYPDMKSFTRMSMGIRPDLNTIFHITNHDMKISKAVRYKEQAVVDVGHSMITSEVSSVTNARPIRTQDPQDIQRAVDWLVKFQRDSTSGFWSSADLMSEISRLTDHARGLFAGSLSDRLDEYEFSYNQLINNTSLPIVSEHGDFCPDNVLVEADGSLKVVDWERMYFSGTPMMDVGSFAFALLRGANTGKIADALSHGSLQWFQESYLQKQDLPFELAPVYYLLRLMEKIHNSLAGKHDVSYLQSNWFGYLKLALDYFVAAGEMEKASLLEV